MDQKSELSEMEMEAVTTVFRQYETGLREAAINARVGDNSASIQSQIFSIQSQIFSNQPQIFSIMK